jgi:hypothetical protein
MEKKFTLIFEFSAKIDEHIKIDAANMEQTKHLNVLLKEVLKNDHAIFDIYKLSLMAYLIDGCHVFEMDKGSVIETNKIELLEPVFAGLSENERKHFREVLEMDCYDSDEYFDLMFNQFGTLKVKKVNFMEK